MDGTRAVLDSISTFNSQISTYRASLGRYDQEVPTLTIEGEDCITVTGPFYGPGGLSKYLAAGYVPARTQTVIAVATAYPGDGPYNNQPIDDRPYIIGPNNGPYNTVPYNNGPYNNGPYQNGPYNQGPYSQGPYNQGPYNQGPYNQGPYNQGPYIQGPYNTQSVNAPWRSAPISKYASRTTRGQRTIPANNVPLSFGNQAGITRTWSSAGAVTIWVDNGQYNTPYGSQTIYVTQPYPAQPINTYQTYSTYSPYQPFSQPTQVVVVQQSRSTVYVSKPRSTAKASSSRSTVFVTTTRYTSRTSGIPRRPPPELTPTPATTPRANPPTTPFPSPATTPRSPASIPPPASSPALPSAKSSARSSFAIVPLSGFSIVPFTGLAKPTPPAAKGSPAGPVRSTPTTRGVTVPGQRPYRA